VSDETGDAENGLAEKTVKQLITGFPLEQLAVRTK
jgi:hypothetical protein